MDYREAYDYLNSFTNYEKLPGINYASSMDSLDRVRLLMRLLGTPQSSFKSVIIAGTKGKGSVAAMMEAVLRSAGHKTGLYTSPHLHTFRERIRVDGELIPESDVARIVGRIALVVERIQALEEPSLVPTTYELITAAGFIYFAEQGVELAVLEVGLGGRLDAVNVADALVSVITPISKDHTQVLGDTVEEIAAEKAGIIKWKGRVITAPQHDEAMAVILRVAGEQHAQIRAVGSEIFVGTGHLPEVVVDEAGIPSYQAFTVGTLLNGGAGKQNIRVRLPLLGNHQQVNAAVAVGALFELRHAGVNITRDSIRKGLAGVSWPARLEIVRHERPVVVVDGAHNVESISKLRQACADLFSGYRSTLVLGLTADKDIEGIVEELTAWGRSGPGEELTGVIVTRSRHPRAADPEEVATIVRDKGLNAEVINSVSDAVRRAEEHAEATDSDKPALVIVTGSLFVAAEAREHYGLATESDNFD